MKIFNEFASYEGIQDSISWLQGTVCSSYEDVQGCKVGIETWWSQIARKLFVEQTAQNVCLAIDETCEFSKTWDCDTCVKEMTAFSNTISSESFTKDLANGFAGPYFCQSPDLALEESQIEACQNYVIDFLPKALNAIFYVPAEEIVQGTCSYYFDICP